MHPNSQTAPNICIIRLSAIGDVCNAATIINRIRMQWYDASITWVCGTQEKALLDMIPNINLIVYDKKAGFKGNLQVWKQLKDQSFDLLLHLQASFRASILTLGIKAKRRIGYHRSRAYEMQWLFTREHTEAPKGFHVVDNYQAFADYLGCPAAPVSWPFELPETAIANANEHLRNVPRPFIAICPGASKAYKNWHSEGYVALIKALSEQNWPIVLLGSPAEIEVKLAKRIEDALDFRITNLVGRTSIAELVALLNQAQLLITPDTGPAHLAASQHTPVIGLYVHHNPERVGPYGYVNLAVSHWQQLIEQQTGKSAAQLPWRSRVKDTKAMQSITAEEILAKIPQALEAAKTTDESEPPNQSC